MAYSCVYAGLADAGEIGFFAFFVYDLNGFLRGGQMSFGLWLNSFSSSVGVSMVVHVFMLFLQDYACGGVFFPLLLQ